MAKVLKKVTPDMIDKLREILVKISRVKGAPKQMKSVVKRLLIQLDDLMKDKNVQKRLATINLLIDIVIKLMQFIHLL